MQGSPIRRRSGDDATVAELLKIGGALVRQTTLREIGGKLIKAAQTVDHDNPPTNAYDFPEVLVDEVRLAHRRGVIDGLGLAARIVGNIGDETQIEGLEHGLKEEH